MGALWKFELSGWIEKFNLANYIETGFGDLSSFNHALKYPFKRFYGVDLDQEFFERAKQQYAGRSEIGLTNGYSVDFLNFIIPQVEGNTLWFIDSHFPISDYHKMSYEDSIKTYGKQALPLEDELKIISSIRDISKDIFIVDDFVLYAENEFCEWGRNNSFQYRDLSKSLGINLTADFVYNTFQETHNVELDSRDQLYFIATPK